MHVSSLSIRLCLLYITHLIFKWYNWYYNMYFFLFKSKFYFIASIFYFSLFYPPFFYNFYKKYPISSL